MGDIVRTLIIAEAGVNHNGDIARAKRLIETAAQAGADYVKFQTFKADLLASAHAPKAKYQHTSGHTVESQRQMLARLELKPADHRVLLEHCHSLGIKFLSTAFDLESLELLAGFNLELYKIPSGEITNLTLIRAVEGLGKPVLLSTGMSTMKDIDAALNVLSRERVTLLQCTTQYPTPYDQVHLRAMKTLQETFGTRVGFSDHTPGINVPLAAVALGAVVIEKHFTLDRNLPGPDHSSSLEPDQLKAMVEGIRQVESALGSPWKSVTPGEFANINVARKSLHLSRDLSAGIPLTDEDLTSLRPGDGISPMLLPEIVGRSLKAPRPGGYKLRLDDLE